MFDELMARVYRAQATFYWELARTHDPYRLSFLLSAHAEDIGHLYDEASQMVKELEEA